MKKFIVLGVLSICMGQSYGSAGCYAATINRCTREIDSFAQYPISCACACDDIIDATGWCSQCGHIGVMSRGQTQQSRLLYTVPDYSGSFLWLAQSEKDIYED